MGGRVAYPLGHVHAEGDWPMTVTADQLVVSDDGPGEFEGAGIVSDFSDLEQSSTLAQGTLNGTAAAISYLGFVKDPFQTALSAGVGWVIEHVGFLREPLDMLAGNPGAIEAHAKTWQHVAKQLGSTAQQRADSATSLTSWQGEASAAYRSAAAQQAQKIAEASRAANELSREVLSAGALVGTVRSTIRDAIADFIAEMVEHALVALAAAPLTLTATLDAFVVELVAKASALAGKIISKISELMKSLAKSGTVLEGLAGRMGELAESLGKVGEKATPMVDGAVGAVKEIAQEQIKDMAKPGGLPKDLGIEVAKQSADVGATESEWVPL
jgi:uncharacterized protein YukE